MADVYEQNLGSKSSLTTSDYIRVVGSDNVSYKQRIENVMQTMGCTRNIGNVSDLSSVPVGVGLGYFLSATGVTEGWYLYNCASPASGSVELSLMGTTSKTMYICQLRSGNWTITKMPTRAEIDALSAIKDFTVTSITNNYYALTQQTPRRKHGNVVTFGVLINGTVQGGSGDYVDIGSIPADCAPSAWCYYSPNPASGGTILAVGPTGIIRLKGPLQAGFYTTITYTR